jgi:antibiotic biosynthesis monooxygenase (ABM) superfamily enzyme
MPKQKPKTKLKARAVKKLETEQDADREAVLDEREKLRRQFPPAYSADIAVFPGDKVEVMLRLNFAQAESLARLLKENKL